MLNPPIIIHKSGINNESICECLLRIPVINVTEATAHETLAYSPLLLRLPADIQEIRNYGEDIKV